MQTLDINSKKISFHDSGQGDVLLFAHGFPLDHTMWKGQIDAFARKFRVIAPDLPGFGESEAIEEIVTMEQMADSLAGLLDAIGIREPIVFCGLSMGGYIAFEFWRKYAAKLKALLLCDTRASADKPEIAANRLATADRVLQDGTPPLVETMMPKIFSQRTFDERPHIVEATRRVMLGTDPRSIAAASRGMAQRRDFVAELKLIGCPTLVLVGANDALSPPSEMKTIADAIPNAKFKIIPNAGHMAPLEQPALANAAIETIG
jgi:pimeloyl-ACP methyl ester carboxylesterase